MSNKGRLVIVVILGLMVGAVASSTGPGVANEPKKRNAKRTNRLQWGVYQILWSRKYGQQLAKELSSYASRPDYIMFYRDLGRAFPKFAVDRIVEQGSTPIVSLELWSWHGRHQGSYLPLLQKGEYDEFLRNWAKAAKADGRRILLRFGFEFNGNWFTWSGDADGFKAAWRRAYDIFKQVGTDNVEWIWSPNIVSCPDEPANDMHLYYPGDRYVDWVGVDGYNFGDNHDQWHRWQTFAEVFDEVLDDFAKRYAGKPVMISEFGCAPGDPDKRARWIREAFANLRRRHQVRAAIWFNYDKRREHEPDWRIEATPGALRAFNETFATP